jgi:serine/threonine-protein phosphatase 2A regulatory subunit B
MEEDIISVISFDDSGKYISLGDRAGRIIIFENPESTKKKDEQFEYFSEFQSHTREFDPLRSIDVEEEITGIEWMRHQGRYMKMLTTNSRNIKLWKIF